MSAADMPELPESIPAEDKDGAVFLAFTSEQMHAYARDYAQAQVREVREALERVVRAAEDVLLDCHPLADVNGVTDDCCVERRFIRALSAATAAYYDKIEALAACREGRDAK